MKSYRSLQFLIAAVVMAGASLLALLVAITCLFRFLYALITPLFKKPPDAVTSTA